MKDDWKDKASSLVEAWIFWGKTAGQSTLRRETMRNGEVYYWLSGTWQDLTREQTYEILQDRGHLQCRKVMTLYSY